MKKQKQTIATKVLGFLLTFVMVLSLLPLAPQTV